MSEAEVSDDHKAAIHEAMRLRGWFVNSFCQIEWLLGDLIARCRHYPEYDEHTKTIPHDALKRANKVRAILKKGGPLGPFQSDLMSLIDRFIENHELRNILAHGFCEFLYTRDGQKTGLRFQKFHRADGVEQMLFRTLPMPDFASECATMTAVARDGMALFVRVHIAMRWAGSGLIE